MKKVKEIIAGLLELTTGYGFYGLGFLIGGVAAWLFGLGWLGWLLLGCFIGKNLQAIRETIGRIKF